MLSFTTRGGRCCRRGYPTGPGRRRSAKKTVGNHFGCVGRDLSLRQPTRVSMATTGKDTGRYRGRKGDSPVDPANTLMIVSTKSWAPSLAGGESVSLAPPFHERKLSAGSPRHGMNQAFSLFTPRNCMTTCGDEIMVDRRPSREVCSPKAVRWTFQRGADCSACVNFCVRRWRDSSGGAPIRSERGI